MDKTTIARFLLQGLTTRLGRDVGAIIVTCMEKGISPQRFHRAIACILAMEEQRDPTFKKNFEDMLKSAREETQNESI